MSGGQRNGGGLVVVVDGDDQSREEIAALVSVLGHEVRAVASGAEALLIASREVPLLLVLDVDLEDASGYEVCRQLRDQFGERLPIMFVSATRTEPRDEVAGLLLGADEYLVKPIVAEVFLARVRRLLARAPVRASPFTLTNRELEVLELLVEGLRRAEVADRLCITPKTTSTHIERILSKLGAHSQAQAVAFALRDGIVSSRG